MNELERKIEQLEKYTEVREQEIEELQENNEKLHKELDYADNYNIYLISRIDEAIEYIKEEQELTDIDEVINTDKLLNILKGDNK